MREIPGARVIRGGRGGERRAGAETAPAPEGPVLRLAPRALPRGLFWRLSFSRAAVFGWLVASFGMLATLVVLPAADLSFATYDRQAIATTTGIEETSSRERKREIYGVSYTFRDEAGIEHRGESYTTEPPAIPGTWEVEYRSDEPSESRLSGMRRRPFPMWIVLVLVFPIAGLGIVLEQLARAIRSRRLLRHGVETRGKLIHRAVFSPKKDNGTPSVELTFEYEAGGRRCTLTVEPQRPETLEDDALEPMLYDPYAPARAMMLDDLPGSPKVTASGELEARPGIASYLLLLLPLLFAALVAATVSRMT
jgi:hypothetical protein